MEIRILPNGSLVAKVSSVDSVDAVKVALDNFDFGTGQGLLELSKLKKKAQNLAPSIRFWCEFSQIFLVQVCMLDTIELPANEFELPQPPHDKLLSLLDEAPPMAGGEYLCLEVLERHWHSIGDEFKKQASSTDMNLREYIEDQFPDWQQVGRVFFHLAENRKSESHPFAFLATYSNRVGNTKRIQHLPLGKALSQFIGKDQKQALLALLKPIQRTSNKSSFIKDLYERGKIYTPQPWGIEAAATFLKEIPEYEKSGIVVRMPNFRKKRQISHPKIQVKLDSNSNSVLGLNNLLSFKVDMTLDGVILTEKEIEEILSSKERLVFLKGNWIEVDKDKLNEIHTHWQKVSSMIDSEGITFSEAMRLMAGANFENSDKAKDAEDIKEWSQIVAGKNLSKILEELRGTQGENSQHASLFPVDEDVLKNKLKATLRSYQYHGLKWLWLLYKLRLGGTLADDMGLGKTLQILALFTLVKHERKKEKYNKPHLLVIPATLIGNWASEIKKFSPCLNFIIAHRSANWGESLAINVKNKFKNYDLVITTYGSLQKITDIETLEFDIMVLDEAQAIKNPKTKTTIKVKEINSNHRVALTGTPIENRLTDLWSMFDFTSTGLLGTEKSFKNFIKGLSKEEHINYAPLRRLVQPYILRRMKSDKKIISDLPDKTELITYCSLTKQQLFIYKETVDQLKKTIKEGINGIKRKGVILSTLMNLKQICNHPSQFLQDNLYNPKHSGKFQRLSELLETIFEKQEKVLIFTQFREISSILNEYLSEAAGDSGLLLHGGTPVKKRAKLVKDFQDVKGPPFMVLSLKAGGTGLNLTAASHVIHFDRWWNPSIENQATDRAYRIGQKKNVLVHKFLCQGTVEEKINDLIESKKILSKEILTRGAEQAITEMSDEELIKLVNIDVNNVIAEK